MHWDRLSAKSRDRSRNWRKGSPEAPEAPETPGALETLETPEAREIALDSIPCQRGRRLEFSIAGLAFAFLFGFVGETIFDEKFLAKIIIFTLSFTLSFTLGLLLVFTLPLPCQGETNGNHSLPWYAVRGTVRLARAANFKRLEAASTSLIPL